MEPTKHIVTVARWYVSPHALPHVLEFVADLRAKSLTEPGCLGYEVFSQVGVENSLLVLERYADTGALEAHRAAPHYKEIAQGKIIPLLTDRRVELLSTT